ncbi:MAG: hypothetical protein EOO50_02030 [Flavobacterium sp.]|uniref:hypothetical protein n=1 Tax=Flavobacterium sp. TaxID=239 RepID=UPI0011FEA619|nr:hypothetical protein [Flavobacterium sp.]RZJ68220.1 MAG: hypothetical protein EOO50_02030 [Flavobacterium sp.]
MIYSQKIKEIFLFLLVSTTMNCVCQTRSDTIVAKFAEIESAFEKNVQIFTHSLIENDVTLYCLFEQRSLGYSFGFTTEQFRKSPCCCIEPRTIYFFWLADDKTFGKRFDYCGNSVAVDLGEIDLWQFYFGDKKRFESEKTKLFTYYDQSKEKSLSIVRHDGISWEFSIVDAKTNLVKKFNELDILKESDGKTNLNFEYNISLKSKRMLDVLLELSKEL